MDIDVTHIHEEFLHRMCGKCFGCGSSQHAWKDGNHDRDLCAYCKCVGHQEVVCMDKFMGKSKSQKAVVTDKGDGEGLNSPLEEVSEEFEGEGAAATNTITLAQLMEQQKALADQIAALCEQDF
jgi:hypothetical protein